MKAMKINAVIALLAPPGGATALERYFAALLKALGVRSDAELAKLVGVPAATLASWKRRGAVPQDQERWFTSEMIRMVFNAWRTALPPRPSDYARASAIEVLKRAGGDPLELRDPSNVLTAWALGGLLALGDFRIAVDPDRSWLAQPDDAIVAIVANFLIDCIAGYRRDILKGTGIAALPQ